MTPLPRIGFIGFGAMASRMGRHLTEAGYPIIAYTPSGKGGDGSVTFLPTARRLAEACDVVLVSVPDDDALEAAMSGEDGALEGVAPGGLMINTSSVSPGASIALAKAARARQVAVIDAPVSGSTPEAESASLVILAGGDPKDIARAQPILDRIGKTTIHAGPAGSGSKLKLIINGVMGAGMAAVAEGLAYGGVAGLDRGMVLDALDSVAVVSPHHKRKLQSSRDGDFSPQFPSRLMQKDMRLLMTEAALNMVPLPTMGAVTQLMSLTRRRHADEDYSVILAVMKAMVANSQD